MKIWISTNGRPSESADTLSKEEGFGRALKGGNIKPKDVLINWGSGTPIETLKQPGKTINIPAHVALATNKLKAFEKFKAANISTPLWTTDKAEAANWGHTLFARTKLQGHSGEGIVVVPKGEDIPDAPLYTFYIFKEREYRVHVCDGKVIDTVRKIRDPQKDVKSWKIRSHENGFIFARECVVPSNERDKLAIKAVQALGLDFGAVDIIEDQDGTPYVLEVNTAPGLEGKTVHVYSEALTELALKYENVL
jgi:glutathione synthase/RimK-type ligase-like ATP-grasp enzyme